MVIEKAKNGFSRFAVLLFAISSIAFFPLVGYKGRNVVADMGISSEQAADAFGPPLGQEQDSKSSGASSKPEAKVANQYIVKLTGDAAGPLGDDSKAPKVSADLAAKYGGTILHVYTHTLGGFSIRMDESAALALRSDPRVEYVEEDSQFSIDF